MPRSRAEALTPQEYVDARRRRIADRIGRALEPIGPVGDRISSEQIAYLVREAEELYWNELAWEELTDEERVAGGHLTELVFPGLLAFVDALLQRGAEPGAVRATHPEVVEELLLFLAARYRTITGDLGRGADSERLVWAGTMTSRLIDLVLYRLCDLTDEEREDLEDRD